MNLLEQSRHRRELYLPSSIHSIACAAARDGEEAPDAGDYTAGGWFGGARVWYAGGKARLGVYTGTQAAHGAVVEW